MLLARSDPLQKLSKEEFFTWLKYYDKLLQLANTRHGNCLFHILYIAELLRKESIPHDELRVVSGLDPKNETHYGLVVISGRTSLI